MAGTTLALIAVSTPVLTSSAAAEPGALPAAPIDPSASPARNRVLLTWQEPYEQGTGLIEYRIYRAEGAVPMRQVATAPPQYNKSNLERTPGVDPTAVPGARYRYQVTAVTLAGEGPPSPVFEATVPRTQTFVTASERLFGAAGLYATASDGARVPIEVDGTDHQAPAVDPSGRRLVYARTDGSYGQHDLWIRNADGSGTPTRMTSGAEDETDPAWSPDGSTLAFTSRTSDGASSVRTMPATGGPSVVRGTRIADPSWLPDGRTLIVADTTTPNSRLLRLEPTGTTTPIAGSTGGAAPAVSPDGRWIAFTRYAAATNRRSVAVLPVGGGSSPAIADRYIDGLTALNSDVTAPSWSTDGERILMIAEWSTSASAPFNPTLASIGWITWNPVNSAAYDTSVAPHPIGVHLTAAPVVSGPTVTFPFQVTDPSGVSVTCTVDGGLPLPCTSPFRSLQTAGRHTVVLTSRGTGLPTTTVASTWTAVSPIDPYYALLGGTRSVLGAPVNGEYLIGAGLGRTYVGGRLYWSSGTGTHAVRGAILSRYLARGGPAAFLGFSQTDERTTPDGIGRYNHFTGGSVYWTPATGAHEVHGLIRDRWAALGWERGRLGYPVSDEYAIGGKRVSDFQRGSLVFDPVTRQVTVRYR